VSELASTVGVLLGGTAVGAIVGAVVAVGAIVAVGTGAFVLTGAWVGSGTLVADKAWVAAGIAVAGEAGVVAGAQALNAIASNNTNIVVFIVILVILLSGWTWRANKLNKRLINIFFSLILGLSWLGLIFLVSQRPVPKNIRLGLATLDCANH
jgi:hypothetical protein